jgi:hypothetical protein
MCEQGVNSGKPKSLFKDMVILSQALWRHKEGAETRWINLPEMKHPRKRPTLAYRVMI